MSRDSEPIRFRMTYEHCGEIWYDYWSCACNSACPVCGTKDIEPIAVYDMPDDELGLTT